LRTEQREKPQSNPATVSLPRRHQRQRAPAAVPGVDLGAAAARRGHRDRSRTGRRPGCRDHRRPGRASPRCPVLPRGRKASFARASWTWPGQAWSRETPRSCHQPPTAPPRMPWPPRGSPDRPALAASASPFTSPPATKTPTSPPTSCGGTSLPATQPRCDGRSYPGPDRPDLYRFPVCPDLITRPRVTAARRADIKRENFPHRHSCQPVRSATGRSTRIIMHR
jgi:hypothetical protein